MATLITQPLFRVFDADGAPLAGGKLFFYEAGTTTPKDTYTDSGAGTANANPVILDAEGAAQVWGDGTYKVVIKDSADATLSTVDDINVPGLPAVDGGGADDGKLLGVTGSTYTLTDTLTDFKIRRVNHQIEYQGSVPEVTFPVKLYFTQPERLYSVKPFTATGAVTVVMSKNGATDIQFGVTPSANVAVTTTATTTAVNQGGNAYLDFAAGDYIEFTASASTAVSLIMPLNTTENYS